MSEKRFGLGAILWVRCECGELNRVPTGSITKIIRKVYRYMTSIAKPQRECCMLVYPERLWKDFFPLWKYLSLHKILKRREREIGPVIEGVANATCEKAMALERMLTMKDNLEGPVEATASYDMGWQRRSSGRAYNSRPGHGVLVGEASGKVLGYGSCITNCKQCEVNRTGGKIKEHNCRMNWNGSSKVMEYKYYRKSCFGAISKSIRRGRGY